MTDEQVQDAVNQAIQTTRTAVCELLLLHGRRLGNTMAKDESVTREQVGQAIDKFVDALAPPDFPDRPTWMIRVKGAAIGQVPRAPKAPERALP